MLAVPALVGLRLEDMQVRHRFRFGIGVTEMVPRPHSQGAKAWGPGGHAGSRVHRNDKN